MAKGEPVPLFTRAAPHVFLFCFIMVGVVWIGMTSIPRLAGDTLYSGPLENETAVPFHAEAGDRVHFRLKAEYPERTKGNQDSNLTVHDADGNVVYRQFSGFIVIKSVDQGTGAVTPPIEPFHPEATGDYTLTWTYTDGTPSENKVKIVKNGFVVERARASGAVFGMMVIALVGALSFLGVRTANPEVHTGLRRFWPVKGATAASLTTAVLAGAAAGVLLIAWVGGVVG